MTPFDKFPVRPPIADEHLHAIGVVTTLWAFLEVNLDRLLRIMVEAAVKYGVELDGKPVSENLTLDFSRRTSQFRELIPHSPYNDQERAEIRSIIDEASNLRGHRDDIVHGAWLSMDELYSPDTGIEVWKQSTKEQSRQRTMKLEQIIHVGYQISRLLDRYLRFMYGSTGIPLPDGVSPQPSPKR